MNEQENEVVLEGLRTISRLADELERLCSSGSGAESCSSDAKRGGQDGAEGRSREGGRVPPGEAEAMERYCKEVAASNMAYAHQHADKGKKQLAAYYAGIAAGWETAAVVLPYFHERAGAGQRAGRQAGDGKQSQELAEADADPNNGTASGRRNSKLSGQKAE